MKRLGFVVYLIILLVYMLGEEGNVPDDVRTPRYVPPPIAIEDQQALPPPSTRDPIVRVQDPGPVRNSTGTAFAIDDDGLWITARHVVDSCRHLGFVNPARRQPIDSGRVWMHPNSDMALVEGPRSSAAVKLAGDPPPQGADAFHIGYPRGKPGDVWSRVIGRERMILRGRYNIDGPTVAYAEIQRFPDYESSLGGMSDGPIFNSAGQVVGVTVAGNPRRGRVTGTAPRSFDPLFRRAGKTPRADDITVPVMSSGSVEYTGNSLRRRFVVARLLCYAS